MNKFESNFFKKYIAEWQGIKWILHIHFIDIYAMIFLWLSMWAIIPSFLYYYSDRIRELVPFIFLECLLIIVFIKIIYDIFDWYNDVWIITNNWVTQLQRALFKTDTTSVDFDKIEWIEVEQNWISDKVLKKWNLIIHKFWDDILELKNAINPYAWVNQIEDFSEEAKDQADHKIEHFDVIMDALWWVVETYLDKKNTKSDKEIEIDNTIAEVERLKWSIDLR